MKKILVIDDDPVITAFLDATLKKSGYNPHVSNDPQEGLTIAKSILPNLIIMDVMLPGIDGAEAVRILKKDSVTENIPIIFLTGLLSGTDETRSNELKVDGKIYVAIAKPVKTEELLTRIKAFVD